MRRTIGLLVLAFAVMQFGFSRFNFSPERAPRHFGSCGDSSIEHLHSFGRGRPRPYQRENFVSDAGRLSPNELPPYSGYGFETPASLACIYGLAPHTPGCNPNLTVTNPVAGANRSPSSML